MGAPIPALGYPSRTSAACALSAGGRTSAEIARQLGIPRKNVIALLYGGTRAGKRLKRPTEENGRTVLFPIIVLESLSPHAARRGISVNELARRIVETVADEAMVDAVLDDREAAA